MPEPARPALSRRTPGVAASRRGTGRFFLDLVRGRVEVLPPECAHEPVVLAPVAGRPRLYLTETALIHEAFVRRAAHLDKGPLARRVLGHALGEGILTADGENVVCSPTIQYLARKLKRESA